MRTNKVVAFVISQEELEFTNSPKEKKVQNSQIYFSIIYF